jgi:hypothetical protein
MGHAIFFLTYSLLLASYIIKIYLDDILNTINVAQCGQVNFYLHADSRPNFYILPSLLNKCPNLVTML